MDAEKSLIERLCRSLAFHALETDTAADHVDDDEAQSMYLIRVAEAQQLILEAGFDFDALLLDDETPTTSPDVRPPLSIASDPLDTAVKKTLALANLICLMPTAANLRTLTEVRDCLYELLDRLRTPNVTVLKNVH